MPRQCFEAPGSHRGWGPLGDAGGWEGAALGSWGAGTPKTGMGALGNLGGLYPAVLGQIAGELRMAEPVSPRVPMVCGLLWKEGLVLGSLCLSFPTDHRHWVREQQGGTGHAGNATVLPIPFFASLKVKKQTKSC